MHNLLLGTAKHMMDLWKELKVLKKDNFTELQQKVDNIVVPAKVGRIPFKIDSNFSSFTADQWKNWVVIYSLHCLYGMLPSEHYSCWELFVIGCTIMLQPTITLPELSKADEYLTEFCLSFELLYSKEHCTPNMHMSMHLKESILNYGPSSSFLVFSF